MVTTMRTRALASAETAGSSPPLAEPQRRALIVDDDREMRASLTVLLEAGGWETRSLARAELVAAARSNFQPDVVLADVRMPGMSGLDLLETMRGAAAPPIVLITAHGDIPMAVAAIRQGAYSFLEKPFDPRRLLTVLDHAAVQHRLRNDAVRLKARLGELSGLDRVLLGQSSQVRALREEILALGDVAAPVLIRGETGTGKELVARAIHDLGPTAGQPFVPISCAALPVEGAASYLTGEGRNVQGVIEHAAGGTLFLDEIGACPLPVQAQLLRILQSSEAGLEREPRARIISATNVDLSVAVARGTFREDLLYRLNAVVLNLPSLRERSEDVAPLFSFFLAQVAQTYEIAPPDLTNDDLTALLTHDWPGNVRELRHAAERRVLAARRGRGSVAEAIGADGDLPDVPVTLREAVATFEREMIAKTLLAHGGRMDAVAEALGIGRRTLNEKITKLGLDKEAVLRRDVE